VHWRFVKDLLNHLKFSYQFVDWIMASLYSVSFSIHVNGQIGGEFLRGMGLKQGDPLSPLLFVLTMEYFTRQMRLISTHPQFAFHPNCTSLQLNHLMFTDNVLIFCKAHPPTLKLIMKVLHDFYLCSGLQANPAKSQVVLEGVMQICKLSVCRLQSFQWGLYPWSTWVFQSHQADLAKSNADH